MNLRRLCTWKTTTTKNELAGYIHVFVFMQVFFYKLFNNSTTNQKAINASKFIIC